jgi:hypothetical protein
MRHFDGLKRLTLVRLRATLNIRGDAFRLYVYVLQSMKTSSAAGRRLCRTLEP